MTNPDMIKHLLKISLYVQVLLVIVIYICAKSIIYSIIFLSGGILSIFGLILTIKMIDRILKPEKKRGQGPFFVVGGLKLAVISAVFYLVSRISETAVLFYILGLSVIPLSVFIEGGYQLYRSFSNGRA
jgi:hypothetical protein